MIKMCSIIYVLLITTIVVQAITLDCSQTNGKMIHTFKNSKLIHFKNCKITSLAQFEHVTNLYIENCDILLDTADLEKLENLTEIHILYSQRPNLTIPITTSLKKLQLEGIDEFQFSCKDPLSTNLEKLKLKNVINFPTNANQCLNNVREIQVYDGNMRKVPEGLKEMYPNLQRFTIPTHVCLPIRYKHLNIEFLNHRKEVLAEYCEELTTTKNLLPISTSSETTLVPVPSTIETTKKPTVNIEPDTKPLNAVMWAITGVGVIVLAVVVLVALVIVIKLKKSKEENDAEANNGTRALVPNS